MKTAPSRFFPERGVSSYLGVIVLLAAAFALSALLYQSLYSSFKFSVPPIYTFRFERSDTGLGFEQVTASFEFDRPVKMQGLLLNGSEWGFASLGSDGNLVKATGGVEFFSVVLPLSGTLEVNGASSAVVDGVIGMSVPVSAGRHALIVVAFGDYTITAPGFIASRQVGVDSLPFRAPDVLSFPSRSFVIQLPMKPQSVLDVKLIYEGGMASGTIRS